MMVVTCWLGYQLIMGTQILIKISSAPSVVGPQMGPIRLVLIKYNLNRGSGGYQLV